MNLHSLKVLVAVTFAFFLFGASTRASETDNRIESSARQSYVFKTFLENDAIHIQSRDGVVTLKGTVAYESHKALAEETVANLPGVSRVRNHLRLKGKRPVESSDEWISLQVKYSLLYNRYVRDVNTQVSVAEGTVTLHGEAKTQAQKDLAGEYAKDIKGVKEVKNEMTLAKTPGESNKSVGEIIDDASITAQVKMALLSHYSTSALLTGVKTNNGVVTLTGNTSSGAGKEMATKVTRDVNGVKDVVNNMTIKDSKPKK
jgi:hyperosmotically inducible periplasmic protein